MKKNTMDVSLPFAVSLPDGSVAEDAVVGLFSVRDRNELNRKYKGQPDLFNCNLLARRLLRLGKLEKPVAAEVIEELPTPVFDFLMEACYALDMGYESVEAFRSSEEYRAQFGV